MERCGAVILTDFPIGESNRLVAELIREARKRGLLREEGSEGAAAE